MRKKRSAPERDPEENRQETGTDWAGVIARIENRPGPLRLGQARPLCKCVLSYPHAK